MSVACVTVGALLLFLAACGEAPGGDPLTEGYPPEICPSCLEWNAPREPFRIFGNSYYVGTEGLSSVLITSSEGHVLQTPISAEGFRFSQRSDLADVEAGFEALEALLRDILITPHPGASSFWERPQGPRGLVDQSACRRSAASAREQFARRLEAEGGLPV